MSRPEGRGPVTVEQVVAARDRRKASRRRMFADHEVPVVCLTLVSPGPVKWWSWTERVFAAAEAELRKGFGSRGWMVREWTDTRPVTGPEAQIAVNASPWEIKRLLLKIEDTHPLGRLWDMDVITPAAVLDRATIGIRPRRCLVCTSDADTCTRLDAHPDDALLQAVDALLARAEVTPASCVEPPQHVAQTVSTGNTVRGAPREGCVTRSLVVRSGAQRSAET